MASTYLTRTFSTGNRDKWTWSAWVKRSKIGSIQELFTAYADSSNLTEIRFDSDDSLQFQDKAANSWQGEIKSNDRFRDTNGWYHIMAIWDTGNSTATDRMRFYVNNRELTSFATDTIPGQNNDSTINRNCGHQIGSLNSNANKFDGIMSHVHFCDGYAYSPSDFGETDTTTGEWKAKTSPSVNYGTTGFLILKDGNTITDQSSNSNDFTLGGGTLTNLKDNPDNVFATMNPNNTTSNVTLTNGNTSVSLNGTYTTYGTIQVTKGKFYWEQKINGSSLFASVADGNAGSMKTVGLLNENYAWAYRSDGNKQTGGTVTSWGNSFTTNDIISTALDMDNGKIYWAKNGVWQESGNPATGANPAFTGLNTSLYAPDGLTPCVGQYSGDQNTSFNFGNGYFGTTAVSSAGTNASDNGIFEYDVPTGYTALSTKGLNL